MVTDLPRRVLMRRLGAALLAPTAGAFAQPVTEESVVKVGGDERAKALVEVWASSYQWESRGAEKVTVRFELVEGSQIIERVARSEYTIGITEVPASAAQLQSKALIQVPVAIDVIVPVVHPALTGGRPLRLPSGVIARAATGTAERWDSLEMKAANPGLPLPALPVRWMPPPEASGAAHAARTYAASVLGATPAADYPRADTKDLQALAAATSSTPGALALLPQDVARISDLHESSVSMLSADGRWVQADAVAVRAALSGTELREKASTGEWALVLNVQRGAWPLLAAQYALVARVQRNGVIAAGALQFIWYSLLRGDPALLDLGRTPLRDALQVAVLRALEKVVDTEGKRVRYKLVGI